MPNLALYIFASGSKGNCAAVVDMRSGDATLVDCGISFKALNSRSAELGFDLKRVKSVLITHEHTDHTRGVGVLLRALAKQGVMPAVYCNEPTFAASPDLQEIDACAKHDLRMFGMGEDLTFADIRIHPFATSHDAASPCGFRFYSEDDALGFMTDTGVVEDEAHEALAGVRLLAIEANHDLDLLRNSPYPAYVQNRIAGERGHLSNTQSAAELELLLSDTLEQVACMHVSQNSNTYELPGKALGDVLARAGHSARVRVAYQNRPIILS